MYFFNVHIPFDIPFLQIKSAVLCTVLCGFTLILSHTPDQLSNFDVEFKDMVPDLSQA